MIEFELNMLCCVKHLVSCTERFYSSEEINKLSSKTSGMGSHSPEGCPKLNPEEDDVVVLLPNTEPCPNAEFWPKTEAVLCPNSPELVLLAGLALLAPKEKELTLLTVGAPKRFPAVVALLELGPNAGWTKEKPLDVPLAGWPKPHT